MNVFYVVCFLCNFPGDVNAPSASATIEQIFEKSVARSTRVRCGTVDYERTRRIVKDVPGMTYKSEDDGVPFFVRFAWESNRRGIYQVPIGRPDLHGSFRVYDGTATVVGGLYDFEAAETRGRNALIMEGRESSIRNYGDLYLSSALELPTSDAARADYFGGWWFPHCITVINSAKESGGKFGEYHVKIHQEQISGSWCDVVELSGFDRVWLDPKLDYAVRRRVRWNSPDAANVLSTYTNDGFQELEPGLWVPFHVEVETGCGNAGVCLKTSMLVREIRLNHIDDSDFRVRLRSGAVVADDATGKTTIYREAFGDTSVEQLTREARRFFRPSRSLLGVLAILSTGVACFVFWLFRRRQRLLR